MSLSQAVHEQMRQRLHQAREDLLGAVRERTTVDDDADAPSIAPLAHQAQNDDGATSQMISHDEVQLAEHDAQALHAIDVAIGRLESGGAGICEVCGQQIPDARLLATPTVSTCIGCQEEREKASGTGRGPSM